jgi:hypothetical protein
VIGHFLRTVGFKVVSSSVSAALAPAEISYKIFSGLSLFCAISRAVSSSICFISSEAPAVISERIISLRSY